MNESKKEKSVKRIVTFSDQAGNSQKNSNPKLLKKQLTEIIDTINLNLDFKSTEKEKINSLEKVIYNI